MSKEIDWRNTKWDVRKWTEEQKTKFQEECFRLGYKWRSGSLCINYLDTSAYGITEEGSLFFFASHYPFNDPCYGTEKKWEDMFPSSKPNSPWHDMPTLVKDHDCSLYYSRILDTCLKCHPEADIRNNKETWGILDTARRDQEFIEEVRRGRK